MQGKTPESLPPGPRDVAGRLPAFEHRWALPEAFRFHQRIGSARVTARIHELATRCKEGLAAIAGKVKLRHADGRGLSAGIDCFEVDGLQPKEIVERLLAKKIIASDSALRDVLRPPDAGPAQHARGGRPGRRRGEGARHVALLALGEARGRVRSRILAQHAQRRVGALFHADQGQLVLVPRALLPRSLGGVPGWMV